MVAVMIRQESIGQPSVVEEGIAEKNVVPAVSGQQNRGPALDRLGYPQHGLRGLAGEGFAVGGDEIVERGRCLGHVDDFVGDAKGVSGARRVGALIGGVVRGPHGERFDVGVVLAHGPADQRGIDAAAQ